MHRVEREEIRTSGVSFEGAARPTSASASSSTTRTGTMRESIEIERGRERRSHILDQADATVTVPSACVAARDSSSPPLTLIDANVAGRASASVSDKSHRQRQPSQQQHPTPPTTTTGGEKRLATDPTAALADKFSSLDKDRFFKQQQDELNNNSIHAASQSYCLSAQQKEQQEQHFQLKQQNPIQSHPRNQIQSAKSSSVLHSATKQTHSHHSQPISPLNLLAGLRMHTNNLRNQQQQLGARISNTNITSSPLSFVESSLNPCNDDEDDEAGAATAAAAGTNNSDRKANSKVYAPRPLSNINAIPSYTSIFDKPRTSQQAASTSSTPPRNQQTQQQPQQQHSNTYQASIANHNSTQDRTTHRSPLQKQAAHFDSLSSSRTLLTTISSIENKSRKPERESKRLPSVFDYTSERLRRPNDYDSQSRSQADYDLEAGSSVDQSQTDDDHEDNEEVDDDDCEISVGAEVDEKSPFNGRDKLKSNTTQARTDIVDGRSRSREITKKFAGSAARTNNFMRPKELSSKKSMSSSLSKKSLAAQPPQAHQTRISMGDMASPPPSFDTSHSQKQDQSKAASCRKLDLLEQVAHLDCYCNICSKNKKLSYSHNQLYHHQSTSGLHAKLSKFDANSAKSIEKNYPKTRFCHMILKSIILVLCTLLLLLLLVSAIALSHYLPQSMDKVMNAQRSFNVTIAGR